MATNRQIRDLFKATAYDIDGNRLGKVTQVYLNDDTSQPDFVEIHHGVFGRGVSLVPLHGHTLENDHLTLAFQKSLIRKAPDFESYAHLSRGDQNRFHAHYGLENVPEHTTHTPARADDPRARGGTAATHSEAEARRNLDVATEINPGRKGAAAEQWASQAAEQPTAENTDQTESWYVVEDAEDMADRDEVHVINRTDEETEHHHPGDRR